MHKKLEPKLFSILKAGYTKKLFLSDLTGGVMVGIVALPLAIAFAIASGVKPEQGLYTAIIAGLVVSVFGGSRVQIAGPTGAFIVIVSGIVQKYGYDGLAVATILAGLILIVMGIGRLGTLLKFVPYPLIVGFTSGVALLIFSTQIKDFMGLGLNEVPSEFISKWIAYGESIGSINLDTLLVSLVSLLIIIIWPKISHRIPGPLVALVAVTAAVHILGIKVETIGSRFGNVPNNLPAPGIPHVSWQIVTDLFSPALTIALLGGIESLLSATVADGMMRTRHRSNMELIAQGMANFISPLFLGIPATGAIARTATNIKNGGRTPVSGIIHSAVLFLIMIFLGKWAVLIPMPTLAAILIVVSYNMSEWHSFLKILKSPKSDVAVLISTFALTVLVDLTVAIEAGIILAALLFMKRMSEVSQVNILTRDFKEEREDEESISQKEAIPEGVEIFEVYGTLFFGAVEQFTESMRFIEKKPKALILVTKNLLAIDATGIHALEDLYEQLKARKTKLLITGIHAQPLFALQQSGLFDRVGEENFIGTLDDALERLKNTDSEKSKS